MLMNTRGLTHSHVDAKNLLINSHEKKLLRLFRVLGTTKHRKVMMLPRKPFRIRDSITETPLFCFLECPKQQWKYQPTISNGIKLATTNLLPKPWVYQPPWVHSLGVTMVAPLSCTRSCLAQLQPVRWCRQQILCRDLHSVLSIGCLLVVNWLFIGCLLAVYWLFIGCLLIYLIVYKVSTL